MQNSEISCFAFHNFKFNHVKLINFFLFAYLVFINQYKLGIHYFYILIFRALMLYKTE